MNYIVLDMEWNQPPCREKTVTDSAGKTALYGEIIRIGAVKLDESLAVIDQFHISILPRFYRRMNSTVGKVTGLKSSSLRHGVNFPAAYRFFIRWCGEDFALLTWGSEDEHMLMSNLAVHRMIYEPVPKFYDLQLIFAYEICRDGRLHALKYALDYYGLEAELKAHDALNDAIYAARVGEKMNFSKYIPDYDSMIEEAIRRKNEKYHYAFINIRSTGDVLNNEKIMSRRCPKCGEKMTHGKWVWQREGVLISCAECSDHGEYFVRVRMKLCPDGKYSAAKMICRLSAEYKELYMRKLEENGVYDE
ncbi:MAG: exonuclease domain-containing protein [Huintestinicola sp.]